MVRLVMSILFMVVLSGLFVFLVTEYPKTLIRFWQKYNVKIILTLIVTTFVLVSLVNLF